MQQDNSASGLEETPFITPRKESKNGKLKPSKTGTTPRFEAENSRLFKTLYTEQTGDPFAAIEWEKRTVEILNDKGEPLFKQENVESPKFWSQTATTVVASKYFRGGIGSKERETSIQHLISRISDSITRWGEDDEYFTKGKESLHFKNELNHILLHQIGAFNSPVWFNVGVEERPQCSACFILSVDDSIDSLLELQRTEGRLFKYGSGAGTNLSSIRSSREQLKGGGVPSGPVSFMKGYDAWAGTIKSGGKTRRAAKMQILDVSHPDIKEFIAAKPTEEKKAWALIEQGYDGGFAVPNGAYDSVAFQNANLSVRVSDSFMEAVLRNDTYSTVQVASGKPCEELRARDVLAEIAEATHLCGDPGIQFDDAINEWHTCPTSGRINSSNPCSEYMHLDNSACNLASINLLKFFDEEGNFLLKEFKHTVSLLITSQDLLIDHSSYPTEAIGDCARNFRQLGLGYTNLGAALMRLGVGYDSDTGRRWAATITALLTGEAYAASARLAKFKGAFKGFESNRDGMLKVIEKHREAALKLQNGVVPSSLVQAAKDSWDEALSLGTKHGFRNSQTTVLAPTGTISFLMDCDTTGIEPDLALVKYKKLSGGGMLKLVNGTVAYALKQLEYSPEDIDAIIQYIDMNDTIEGAPKLKAEHLSIFDCALKPANGERSISWEGHLKMMSAVQPFLSGAISKTVNLPRETTPAEIFDIYVSAWRMGLKAVALYRDGSKRTQPLSQSSSSEKSRAEFVAQPVRRRLPDERNAFTHKFTVAGLEGYLTVGVYEDRTPGEIFLVVAKEGSTLSGMTDAFATSISIALQYGVPLKVLVRKFAHMRFEPAGFTPNSDIPMAKSIIDYVFRWLALKFLPADDLEELGISSKQADQSISASTNGTSRHSPPSHSKPKLLFQNMEDAPPCTNCGSSLMVRQAGCYVCLNCSSQGGCG